MSTYHILV